MIKKIRKDDIWVVFIMEISVPYINQQNRNKYRINLLISQKFANFSYQKLKYWKITVLKIIPTAKFSRTKIYLMATELKERGKNSAISVPFYQIKHNFPSQFLPICYCPTLTVLPIDEQNYYKQILIFHVIYLCFNNHWLRLKKID